MSNFQYYCQPQAEAFARAIVPVPKSYPLSDGLSADFPAHFSNLCAFAKSIYLDMAKQPEAYGLMLVDITSQDHNLARDGYRTIHRFAETLRRLMGCGQVENHRLTADAAAFGKALRTPGPMVAGTVPKAELILSRLVDFGFVISDFTGKPFAKKLETFTVEYPDDPDMIDTIKTYCQCWESIRDNRPQTEYSLHDAHHRFYRFDYKLTSNPAAIPVRQWVVDDGIYLDCPPDVQAFSLAFYDASLHYQGLQFNGEYLHKKTRAARICPAGYTAMGNPGFVLHMRLRKMDQYAEELAALPEGIKKVLSKDCCNFCDFQGATPEHCKYRVHWTLDGQPHVGCAHACFYFDDFSLANVPHYWRLLELEYGLKRT